MTKKILISLAIIAAVGAIVVGATTAYFSDTETSAGNTISSGALDLTLNGYNNITEAVVIIDDMKPCQTWYSGPITLSVYNNPGKIYKHIVNDNPRIVCEDVITTEPECEEDGGIWIDGQGCTGNYTPRNYLPEVTWFDLERWEDLNKDGNIDEDEWVVLIPDEEIYLDGIASKWIYLGTYGYPMMTNELVIRQSFHMDASAGNEYQSDTCTFTEEFMVIQTNVGHPGNPYIPQQNVVLDSIDVGDSDSVSMTTHNAQGWFDDPRIGGYGGRDGDGMGAMAMIGGDDDNNSSCDPDEDWAMFEMDAGIETADTLIVRHLDGSANDTFNVYVNDILVGSYTGGQTSGETWVTTTFDLGTEEFSGSKTIKLEATVGYPWGSCPTYGQVAVNWAKITN